MLARRTSAMNSAGNNRIFQCFRLHVEGEDIGEQLPKRRSLWGILVCVVDGARSSRREILRDRFLKAWACRCCLVLLEVENWSLGRPEKGLRFCVYYIGFIWSSQRDMLLCGSVTDSIERSILKI